jgi:hypothetical protein
MDTEATVPLMVLTRLTSPKACSASVRVAWAVSMEAWSTASCSGEAALEDDPPDRALPDDPPADEPEDEPDAEPVDVPVDVVAADAVVEVVVRPDPEYPVEPVDPLAPPVVDELLRAAFSADSSWLTFLRSADTLAWAAEAWLSASAQVVGAVPVVPPGDAPEPPPEPEPPEPEPGGPEAGVVELPADEWDGLVVVVVVVVVSHSLVAAVSAALAAAESASACFWSATSVACNLATCWACCVDDAVVPDEGVADGVVVAVVADADDVLVVSVSLASAAARVAWAEATLARAWVTAAWRVDRSSDARVWPAATFWPTVTSTAATVPEALKLRSAWLTGVMVPTSSRVDWTVPVLTSAVR